MEVKKIKTIRHKGIRDGVWYNGSQNFIIAAADGVWLYDISCDTKDEPILITDGKISSYRQITSGYKFNFRMFKIEKINYVTSKDSDIFYLSSTPQNESKVAYITFCAQLGLIDIENKTTNYLDASDVGWDISCLDMWELKFTPDGKMVAGADDTIDIWDTSTLRKIPLKGIDDFSWPICWHTDSKFLLCCDGADHIVFYDVKLQKVTNSISGKNFGADSETIRVSNNYTIVSFFHGKVRLWFNKSLELLNEMSFPTADNHLEISPNEDYAVFWYADKKKPQIYSLPDFQNIYSFNQLAKKILIASDKLALVKTDSIDFYSFKINSVRHTIC